jgi:hypothetical protein
VVHRLGQVVLALTVLATPALALVPASASERADVRISAPSRFSPNGDGVKDDLRIRIRLSRSMHVRLEIGPAGARTVNRRVDLGRLSRGTHTWTWDGRNQSGRTVADWAYRVRAYDVDDPHRASSVAVDTVHVDTAFAPTLSTPRFGAAAGAPARVYPRTKVVTDTLELRAEVSERSVASLELVIRTAKGRVVRRADVSQRLLTATGGTYGRGRVVAWAAVRGGRPLPAGRYTAVVAGADRVGNSGRSERLRIWVSDDPLVWREATTTVSPDATDFGPCAWTTANGCGDYPDCGEVVPSALYAGGLSYRAAPCAVPDAYRDVASGRHLLEVPEATGVRGLAAARVSFAGAPTTAGEPDTGTLQVWGDREDATVTGTSGQSAWVEDPAWGEGRTDDGFLPQRDPAVVWSFVTRGTDSVDVASFTVDARYLAVAD